MLTWKQFSLSEAYHTTLSNYTSRAILIAHRYLSHFIPILKNKWIKLPHWPGHVLGFPYLCTYIHVLMVNLHLVLRYKFSWYVCMWNVAHVDIYNLLYSDSEWEHFCRCSVVRKILAKSTNNILGALCKYPIKTHHWRGCLQFSCDRHTVWGGGNMVKIPDNTYMTLRMMVLDAKILHENRIEHVACIGKEW